MLLNDKTVVITGANGGIGKPLVDELVCRGARVIAIGRSPAAASAHCDYIQADLSDSQQLSDVCIGLQQRQPDVLVNLAGQNAFVPYENQPASTIEALLTINLTVPMHLARCVLPNMLVRQSGQIVNVGSVLGCIGSPFFAAYTASKAGLRGFSESLRREVTGRGVIVTHVNPRAVDTVMNNDAMRELNRRTKVAIDKADNVARIIANAIERDQKEVTLGRAESFYVKLNSLLPVLVDDSLIANRHIAEDVLAHQPQVFSPMETSL